MLGKNATTDLSYEKIADGRIWKLHSISSSSSCLVGKMKQKCLVSDHVFAR